MQQGADKRKGWRGADLVKVVPMQPEVFDVILKAHLKMISLASLKRIDHITVCVAASDVEIADADVAIHPAVKSTVLYVFG